jgi:hypothetical protein
MMNSLWLSPVAERMNTEIQNKRKSNTTTTTYVDRLAPVLVLIRERLAAAPYKQNGNQVCAWRIHLARRDIPFDADRPGRANNEKQGNGL